MADTSDDGVQVLRALWSAEDRDRSVVDEECGPVKPCRNMKDVGFDGFDGFGGFDDSGSDNSGPASSGPASSGTASSGTDLKDAWRERLAREGKLGSGRLLDLVDSPTDE